jgi:hypothetical protein
LALGDEDAPIAAKSKKQTTIALSSAEAEIMALFECVKSVLFMRQLLEDMGMPQTEPTVIHVVNFNSNP